MPRRRYLAGRGLALILAATGLPAGEIVAEQKTQYASIQVVKLQGGLQHPWGLSFLPDGRKLITERTGGMSIIDDGELIPVDGLPDLDVYAEDAYTEGGLLDVAVHPEFEDNGWIYFSRSRLADGEDLDTVPVLLRARLDGNSLTDMEEIFVSNAPNYPGRHYGGRIAFLDDGTLLMSIGDRGSYPPRAQKTWDHSGSIIRLHADGSVPDDNPFLNQDRTEPELFSIGHRNIQGLIQVPATGEIWSTEHGPRGGDELNLIEPGRNYGWPIATLGRAYLTEEEFPDSETRHREGMVDPKLEFMGTMAPSGLTVVSGDTFPEWEGNLLAGALAGQRIWRLVIEDQAVVHSEELLLHEIGRIRVVQQGPDGKLYVLTDHESDGGLYRIEPK
ncbi:PQQ-dependent sugar dehydrogenase [Methylonatrum kenyense]|uniref:PQQ-dependent sugar dehydrogenase n=1 Tax=Methylonatrum kenyense TaxID=455253 RepID=UPI0020C0B13E|nr:PQQ-dependent sugar dehydrogenase [Methylonatrum kenyense]MCK8515037.1 PQQ-dependent sugar dehydrogenase [Methylonatrum kenyense]